MSEVLTDFDFRVVVTFLRRYEKIGTIYPDASCSLDVLCERLGLKKPPFNENLFRPNGFLSYKDKPRLGWKEVDGEIRIFAFQGHTDGFLRIHGINLDLLQPVLGPESDCVICHSTNHEGELGIRCDRKLKSMGRSIHFWVAGESSGRNPIDFPVVFKVRASDLIEAGFKLRRAFNGVVLCYSKQIPISFFEIENSSVSQESLREDVSGNKKVKELKDLKKKIDDAEKSKKKLEDKLKKADEETAVKIEAKLQKVKNSMEAARLSLKLLE